MTRASLREYAAVQRERYQQASRAEKHRLLDEMVAVTGMHRKAAIRLLNVGGPSHVSVSPPPRPVPPLAALATRPAAATPPSAAPER